MIEFTYPRESPYLGSFFFFFGYTVIQFCNWESLPLCRIPKYIEKHNAPRVWIVTARESTVKHRGGTRHESRTNGGFRNVRARTRPRHGNCWPGYWAPLTLLDSVHSNKPSGQSIARSKIVFVTGDGHASLLLPTLRGRLRSKRIHFARRRERGRGADNGQWNDGWNERGDGLFYRMDWRYCGKYEDTIRARRENSPRKNLCCLWHVYAA